MHLHLDFLLKKATNVHFIGISGISMKGLALFTLRHYSHLKVSGITNMENYSIENINMNVNIKDLPSETSIIVYTSCLQIKHENILEEFKNNNYLCLHRSEFLNLITGEKKRILITGAHGKTSTTYFTYQMFKKKNYGCFIGVDLKETGTSYIDGENGYIIEGDESDASYVNINPINYILVNNISTDHLENYQNSFEEYLYSFEKYFFHQKALLIYNKNKLKQLETPVSLEESANSYLLTKLVERTKVKNISYGVEKSDVNIEIISYINKLEWRITTSLESLFSLNNRVFTVSNMTGEWNIYNITASLIVATLENVEFEDSLDLKLPQRRMDCIFQDKNKKIYDDYAVHPTEIYNVLKLYRQKYDLNKVGIIWEPHRPSRIRRLATNFYEVFEDFMNNLFVFPIYNASEKDILSTKEVNLYLNYKNKISEENFEKTLSSIINNSQYEVIILLSAGKLSKKVREICANF